MRHDTTEQVEERTQRVVRRQGHWLAGLVAGLVLAMALGSLPTARAAGITVGGACCRLSSSPSCLRC